MIPTPSGINQTGNYVTTRVNLTGDYDSADNFLFDYNGTLTPAPVKEEEEPLPEPDFQASAVILGPTILLDAYRMKGEMFAMLDEGLIDEALEKANDITLCFPTEPLRKRPTVGKNLREEMSKRCKDFANYGFEKVVPRLGISV